MPAFPGDFEIGFMKYTGPFTMGRFHYHEYYEIYYLLSGERYYYIENRRYLLKKGCLLFINKNFIHKTVDAATADHERVVVYFSDDYIDQFHAQSKDFLLYPFLNEHVMIELDMYEQNFIEGLLFQMHGEYMEERQGYKINFKALLVQLLTFSARKKIEQTRIPENPMHSKITSIVNYCNENFSNDITLESMSKQFFISPSHLSRLFKKMTGSTFTEYINTLRIREAQQLIRETRLKIIQISEQVGFDSISHFNRKFKQVTKMTPLEYKKIVKSDAGIVRTSKTVRVNRGNREL